MISSDYVYLCKHEELKNLISKRHLPIKTITTLFHKNNRTASNTKDRRVDTNILINHTNRKWIPYFRTLVRKLFKFSVHKWKNNAETIWKFQDFTYSKKIFAEIRYVYLWEHLKASSTYQGMRLGGWICGYSLLYTGSSNSIRPK